MRLDQWIGIIGCCLLSYTTVTAQPSAPQDLPAADAPAAYFRYHKRMPASFSGFAVELVAANTPLPRDYELFKRFGNVHYDKIQRGRYTYLIPVGFTKKKSVEKYLTDIVHPLAPDATIVEYRYGQRLETDRPSRKKQFRFD